jgi:hypothetical protein
MGICFEHALLVEDLAWRPTKERAEAIHSALVTWGLVDQASKPELLEIDGARARKISGNSVLRAGKIPDELVMDYPTMIGDHVRTVMGPYVNEDADGFEGPGVWGLKLVLGRDFKVLEGADYGPLWAKLLSDGGATYRNSKSSPAGVCVPATWTSTPPKTSVVIRDPMTGELPKTLPKSLDGFAGLWRSGLWIDFDKVYPTFHADGFGKDRSHGGLGRIPNRAFVSALEHAFGTRLLEIGMYV